MAIGEGADLFRQALPDAPEACRLTLAQALGVLGDAASANALLDLLDSPDADVRLASVWGLARIAEPATVDTILKAADTATGYERIKATQACLLLAENLLAADHMADGQRVYRHLQQTRTDDAERYVRQAATLGLAGGAIAATRSTDALDGDGWQVLFDGKNLHAWQNARGGQPGAGWVLEDGAMVRKQRAGDIWTKERFGDFVLDLEFNTQGNSGVFIRTDRPTDNVQTGIEIQVYNPTDRLGTHSCGAVYDCLAPSRTSSRRTNGTGWSSRHAITRLCVEMNGQQIIDMDLNQWTEAGKNPDGTRNKFRNAMKDFKREGHIGMQDHGAAVAYRNVRIKSLKAQP